MGQAKIVGGGGSTKVTNGVIQKAYSSNGVIDRNTFVELDEYPYNQEIAEKSWFAIQTESLTDSLGLVVYSEPDSSNVYSIKARILRTPGASVTMENTQVLFTGTTATGYSPTALIKINETQALLFYTFGPNPPTNTVKLSAVILTINGSNITVGTSVAVETTEYYIYKYTSVKKLSDGKYFVGYKKGFSSGGQYIAVICTISGNTISFGSKQNVKTADYNSHNPVDVQPLANGKVLYCLIDTYAYYTICTVSGTSISNTTAAKIANSYNTFSKVHIIEVNDNVILVLLAYISSGAETFWCIVGNAATTDIDWGSIVKSTWNIGLSNLDGLKYANNQAVVYLPIAISGTTSNYEGINKLIITVDSSTKTPSINRAKLCSKEKVLYNMQNAISIAQKSSEIFLVGYIRQITNQVAYGDPRIFSDIDLTTVHKSTDIITGLSKSKLTPERLGEVWLLNKEA